MRFGSLGPVLLGGFGRESASHAIPEGPFSRWFDHDSIASVRATQGLVWRG